MISYAYMYMHSDTPHTNTKSNKSSACYHVLNQCIDTFVQLRCYKSVYKQILLAQKNCTCIMSNSNNA